MKHEGRQTIWILGIFTPKTWINIIINIIQEKSF